MNAFEKYESWLSDPYFDEETKQELLAIKDEKDQIEERFFTDLKFGTAGLRGIIAAGTNRMNKYTVRKATQGLANYIRKVNGEDKGVAIAYDSRHRSTEFAKEAALCLCANGIKAYLFDALRPTPELSFAVRFLGCIAGINITASHNPSNYNGYKVYWEDGAQITPPHDTGIMEEVSKLDFSESKSMNKEEAQKSGLFRVIGKEVDDAYMEELKKCVQSTEAVEKYADQIKIVYTPLHGTGNVPVRRILAELGFSNVYVVPEQEKPDGDFPTVSYPNPETAEAFELGIALAKKTDADLVLATDPDADRLGVWVKNEKDNTYVPLNGNMSGSLLADYELKMRKLKNGIPADGKLISTIVSTNLAKSIAGLYGVEYVEVLTGFKYIGQKIYEYETSGCGTYIFGFEESYGCLIGTYARDKDAVAASMALCEAAAYYKSQNMSLYDAMQDLYERAGYYKDEVTSLTLAGMEGLKQIEKIMSDLKNDPPKEIGGCRVLAVRDYEAETILDTQTKERRPTGLPKAKVMYFDLEDDAWVCVRPSGTEPKVKFYYGVKAACEKCVEDKAQTLKAALEKLY